MNHSVIFLMNESQRDWYSFCLANKDVKREHLFYQKKKKNIFISVAMMSVLHET